MKKKLYAIMAVACIAVYPILAADNVPISITADTLEYDGQSGEARADGNVVVIRDQEVLKAPTATFNIKTESGQFTGGVVMTGPELNLTAAEVSMKGKDQLMASGNVQAQRQDKKFSGDQVEYNLSTEYGKAVGHAFVESEGTSLWADSIQAWMKEVRAVGEGNVRIVSEEHQLVATGDKATYTQTPNKKDGVVFLSGNAKAVQNGNTLESPELEIHMENNSARTNGRSTLVVTPQ